MQWGSINGVANDEEGYIRMKSNHMLQVVETIDLIFRFLVQLIIFVMMVLIVSDAIGRAFNYPMPGAWEITGEYLMVAIVFLGLGFTQRAGRHIKVELFNRWIPQLNASLTKIILNAVAIGYFGLMAYYGWSNTAYAIQIKKCSISELAYPLAPAYFLVVIGCAFMCIWLAVEILQQLASRKDRRS